MPADPRQTGSGRVNEKRFRVRKLGPGGRVPEDDTVERRCRRGGGERWVIVVVVVMMSL